MIVKFLKWALSKFEPKQEEITVWPFPEPKPKRKPAAKIAAKKATTVAKKTTKKAK